MSNESKEQFFIRNLQELFYCLKQYEAQPQLLDCVVRLWLERGYIDNLLYLEYRQYEQQARTDSK